MNFEINKLLQSEIAQIKDIAWLLYEREGKGLAENETNDLVGLLLAFDSEFDIFIQEETNKIYQEGYDEGYNNAKLEFECNCRCDY